MSKTDSLFVETARKLGEARRILEGVEATALGGVAQILAETAESLARTARELKGISPDEWLTFEEAAAYLKKTPKAFEKIVARGEIPKHYLTERGHWVPVGHGLFRLDRYPEGENEDLVRLYLWSRNRDGEPQAVVSHETALGLHGLSDLMPEKVHLSVPKGFRKRPPRGVVLHKSDLSEAEAEDWNGFRVTTPLRTILDVARSREVSPEHLESAVREAVARGLVRRKRLRENLSRLEDDERHRIAEEALREAVT